MNHLHKIQQRAVNMEKPNGYHWPNNQLQQFLLANQSLSLQGDKNNLAKMQVLYESHMKWACLNNYYNQRLQQMFYAAFIIAQNNFKKTGFLPPQQNVTNSFMPQRNWRNLNYNQRMFSNQANKNPKNLYHSQNKNDNSYKSTSKTITKSKNNNSKKYNKVDNKFTFPKTMQPNQCKPNLMKDSDLQNSLPKYKVNQSNHMQALIAGFATKKETDSLKTSTNKEESLLNFTKPPYEISIKIPQIIENSKSRSYLNLSPGRGSSENHQIIVTETEAEMIVNQVKEEMRGRDPEN